MIWAILSIFSGLGDAIAFAALKKLGRLNDYLVLGLRHLATLPFLLIGFLFYQIPNASHMFYLVVAIDSILILAAMLLMIKSFHLSDLSKSVPMLSFTPVFLLFVSYILLNELPSLIGFLGIFIVVIGSYVLNLSRTKLNYLEPFKALFKEKGILLMLIVSFLFSISATLTKIGVELSNPAYFIFVNYVFASIISIIFFIMYRKHVPKIFGKENLRWILLLAVSTACMEIFYAIAVKFALVSYSISLKRTSVLFSVLIGVFFFKEKNIKESIAGALIMFAGAVVILLS